jgi:hypothetical protein
LNGTPLDLPYQIADCQPPTCNPDQVVIQASVKDSLVSATGGGIVKVSWPFYPQDRWTSSYDFHDPNLNFQVARVGSTKILIQRIDRVSFDNAPENIGLICWKLLGEDVELDLPFPLACKQTPVKEAPVPAPVTPAPKKTKGKPATPPKTTEQNPKQELARVSNYAVIATIPSLPDKLLLVAPNSAIYNLDIPAFKAAAATGKVNKTGPLELKQYDSQWIDIKSADLTTTSVPPKDAAPAAGAKSKGPDLSQVDTVEANGIKLNFVKEEDTDATAASAPKSTPPVKSITVEVTRDLTSKPGTVDIGFRDAKGQLLGTRQLHIAQTDWSSKGDK